MKTYVFLSLLLPVFAQTMAQPASTPNRLLVVSGGGARGAWGVGIANYLDSLGYRYAHVVGTSTGSLMAPLILLRRFQQLNLAYTTTTQQDIFNRNPFKKDGSLRVLNALFRLGKPSLGETENLRKRITEFISPDLYQQLINSPDGLDFTVSVVNLRTLEAGYQSARQNRDYQQMVNWIWASANEPVFMSPYLVERPGGAPDFWVDGGVRNPIAIRQGLKIALERNYTAVDVVINGPVSADEPASDWPNGKGTLLKSLIRTLNTYGSGTREMNIAIGRLINQLNALTSQSVTTGVDESTDEPGIELAFYFMPARLFALIPNELIFDPARMNELLTAGRRGDFDRDERMPVAPLGVDATVRAPTTIKLSRQMVQQLLDQLQE